MDMQETGHTENRDGVRLSRSLTLPNDVQTIPQLGEFVDGVGESLGLDMSLTMSLNLAIEEAVVNVMNYAYDAGTVGEVRIDVEVAGNAMTVVISDSGRAFDPTQQPMADTTLSLEERQVGGLGIFLVRQLMDDIRYERVGDRNVLTLYKKI